MKRPSLKRLSEAGLHQGTTASDAAGTRKKSAASASEKLTRILVLAFGLSLALSGGLPLARRALRTVNSTVSAAERESKPRVQVNIENAGPREVEESTQQAIARDYAAAWKALNSALANNSAAPLNDNFIGYALDKYTQRVKDQQKNGLKTRIVDNGHKMDAIFYSPDGSAIELHDTASLETQILDGGTVLHSDQAQVHYYAVMTPSEDRWKVRVLEGSEK